MSHHPIWALIASLTCVSAACSQQDDQPITPAELAAEQQTAPGSLAIRAIQGTTGGPAVSGNKVEVHLFHRGEPFQRIDGTLNEMGLLVLSDLPVAMGIRPLVRIEHGGVTYQDSGPEMTPESPNVSVEVVVFETTKTKPAWRVASRQAIVTPAHGRLLVTESVYVDNPNDKTWLGDKVSSNGKLTTVELGLPEHTENISLDAGFHGWCCTTYENNTLGVQMPLMPGRYVYQFTYDVPITDGTCTIALPAEAPTDELAVIIPESGIQAEPVGLAPGSVQMTESGPMRLYVGRQINADQIPSLTLIGLTPTPPPPPPPHLLLILILQTPIGQGPPR